MSLRNVIKGEQPLFIKIKASIDRGKTVDTGEIGEYLIEYALEKGSVPGRYRTFCNIYVPHRGRMAEIDVIMLHEKGIFVFESKNYSGWIFGSENQTQWTTSQSSSTKHRFYNPIKQNRSHIEALASGLEIDRESFHSVIVFSERCELKKVPQNTESFTIIQRQHTVRTMKMLLESRDICFDDAQFEKVAAKLETMKKTDDVAAKHLEVVQAIQAGQVCPWCGGELVERNGRNGTFRGCSGFPKCRYTAKIK
ncbi:NERD domain-containing protein [Arcanobacterium bovis]|uniref:NERD domain-containing protein n=1 Tax=Arcanobacterium bovis TaxID=2529275 RepID=A0A4Q9V0T8_9ACTO|nr:NERD domain-containing protein [Arcanobacterium bovis]TBW22277.1 NERD domain-containing protein [Arcanobacterium bovis]